MAQKNVTETPMMQQFNKIKEQYPDALLLFRCGDFYETYSSDAVKASKVLGITLTHRSNGGSGSGQMEMAGFPFHALDTYLPKLVRAGMRVAICDQLEDPKLTKKLVKRGVTELVTPGVSYSDATLVNKENNFVACVHFAPKELIGIAFLDISTGEFLVAEGRSEYVEKLLSNFAPKEVLHLRGKHQQFEEVFGNRYFTFEIEDWMLTESSAHERLLKQFETTSLKGFGVDKQPNGVIAAGAILHYLDMTQHLQTSHIAHLSRIEEEKYLWLDKFTLHNLELFPREHDDSNRLSLLQVMDRTITPMGGRMLRRWLAFPLKNIKAIQHRQAIVEEYFRNPNLRETVTQHLQVMGDLERMISKVSTGRISPRDMLQLGHSLRAIEPLRAACMATECQPLKRLVQQITLCHDMSERIIRTMVTMPPAVQGRPDMIAAGVDAELDELRAIHHDSKQGLMVIQQREAERTGIASLKIGFNNVFGYYLEVRNTYKDMVPPEWVRKQTLAQAERYITEELHEYEEKILTAGDKIQIIENRIFMELIMALQDLVVAIQVNAQVLAQLDCLLCFATIAEQNRYICPDVNDSLVIDIHGGRHPVIEQQLPAGESYISNDVMLDNNGPQIIIITGPNMAGKSALLRQTALIVLMAQMGSFVPAESASIGMVDKIFTRVGASDNISSGESTFMVEMNEASAILNNLSERSLILFDELGRGTSTYDGISIAWAIVEYIHESKQKAKTLFATHYHELNDMADSYTRIRNYNVSVREINKKVIFLRKLVPGGSNHSFGIHVAKMAGMPKSIVARAESILLGLETQSKQAGNIGHLKVQKPEDLQLSIFQLEDPVLEQIRDEFLHLDVNNLTPIEALNKLNDLKHIISGK